MRGNFVISKAWGWAKGNFPISTGGGCRVVPFFDLSKEE